MAGKKNLKAVKMVNAMAEIPPHTLEGTLAFDYGLPATGVTVRLYDVEFGGQAALLAKDVQSDGQGHYSIAYRPARAGGANLQVRALDSNGKEVVLSGVRYRAKFHETLNLVVPAGVKPLASEFQRLAADMERYAGGVANLGRARENSGQRDLTLLYRSTGWDARLVALAATAAQQAKSTGLGQDLLYALYRTGLPTDPDKLALLPPATIAAAINKANESGIASFTPALAASAQRAFADFAAKTRLALKAPGAPSSFQDLLGNNLSNAPQKNAFLDAYFDPTAPGSDLWRKAEAAGIPAGSIKNLKLRGKLAFLTFNNAKLMDHLQGRPGVAEDVSRLADQDFHLPDTWKKAVQDAAGKGARDLTTLIPGTYGGATPADRLEAYAADMARKIRVAYPNRVVARMVETQKLSVPGENTAPVAAFLRAADDAGFQLGKTPLNAFLNNLPRGVPKPDRSTAEWVKTLHRTYQITPSNESMQEVLRLGFKSARDIAAYQPEEFQERFGAGFPTPREAGLVYRKAQQVNSVVFNLYNVAKQLDTQPLIYALSDTPEARQSAKQAIAAQFPSMGSLFGSLDFCGCDDCRSVLSPAAYLVDILHFLDPDPADWDSTKSRWRDDHGGEAYPYGTPFSVLTGRRPDLPNLNLSCENTNTALPYIDAVNEILEYYAANGQLDGKAAYDTGSAASADLIAEPQNILPGAYSILANRVASHPALYPLGLPFDLWIETVRGFLSYFNMPLDRVLDVFRPGDPLELFTDPNHYPYYRASIFAESLGISPAEYALYADDQAVNPSNAATPQDWYKFYGYADAATASSALGSSAKTLAGRLGVTYQDLSDLVETGFLNPGLAPLKGPFQKFGLSLADVFSYTGQPGYTAMSGSQKTDFESKLQAIMARSYPQGDPSALKTWLNNLLAAGYSNRVLVLKAPPVDGCDFEDTSFQYAGGNPATSLDFLKLNLFVRLWKKLGWPLDEVDQALQVFLSPLVPDAGDADFGQGFSNAVKSALAYLAHLQDLSGRLQPGPYGRAGILPLWSAVPTRGTDPLYARLFLTPAVLNNDPAFDDPTGNYLSAGLPVKDHLPALQGALGLTANDVEAILKDAGQDVSTAALTLDTLSLLYRYALLSQGLQLSVPDFISLKSLSGLDPFQPLKTGPLSALSDDAPFSRTLQFVQQAEQVRESGFSVGDLDYLLRQKVDDPAGPYSQAGDAPVLDIQALSSTIHSIRAQNAVPSDPAAFTDVLIQQKTAQVFPASVAQTFMGMWTGTLQYKATASGVSQADSLPPSGLAGEPEIQLSYDPVTSVQTLVFQGVPVSSVVSRLDTAVAGSSLTAGQKTLFQDLLTQVRDQAQSFFQDNLQETAGTPSYGFLPASDFDLLFTPIPATDTQAQQQTLLAQKRSELASRFLPYLQKQLVVQAVLQFQSAQLGAGPSLTRTLLTDTAVLADPTQPPSPGTPLLEAFQAAGDSGVTATYYSDAAETTSLGSARVSEADTSAQANPAKPAGVNSARFEGCLVVPADGPYSFTAVMPNASATGVLQFDFMTEPLLMGQGTASGSAFKTGGFTQLKAGMPYRFTADFQGLSGGDARILVQGETLPLGPLSGLILYPAASVERYARAHVLLSKAFQLAQGLGLDESEVVYLAVHGSDFGNLSFNGLPTRASDDAPAKAQALFGQFLRLANYASLRKGPAGNTDGLLKVFGAARQTLPASLSNPAEQALAGLCRAVADLTRRDTATVQALIAQLWGSNAAQSTVVAGGTQVQVAVPALVNDLGFARLWQALQMVQTLGVQPSVLGQVTGIAYPSRAAASSPADPGAAIAQALRNAVKARYSPASWRPVAQAIFDPLRRKKRDALCAYLLALPALEGFGATDTNGLFEYFLVDPGMEPVVTTSRIRLALSSVQTFIQRCLLNLEPQVKPSVIDSARWEWMKRYRVWEANREIFLWPENWLIPEFRENATDLFQALQSALLQGDVTANLVEEAYTAYLQGLEERARLDIVSLFNQPAAPGDPPGDNVLHVIGRNHGKPQKYFYRTFANGLWSGWEPVTVDMEGDHIAAVVWRGRLCLFWLTFLVQGGAATASPTVPTRPASDASTGASLLTSLSFTDLANQAVQAKPPCRVQVQLNWTEYYQGKWSKRKSSDITRFTPVQVADDFDPKRNVYVHVSVDSSAQDGETAVRVHLDGMGRSFRLTGKNSEPDFQEEYWQRASALPFDPQAYDATKFVEYDAVGGAGAPLFEARFLRQLGIEGGLVQQIGNTPEPILQTVNSYNILPCDNLLQPDFTDELSAQTLYAFYRGQVEALSSPFFYEDTSDPGTDRERTFFVQPNLAQTTTRQWDGWAVSPSYPDWSVNDGSYWKAVQLRPQVPVEVNPNPPDPGPEAIYQYLPSRDWVASQATRVAYGTELIGREGGLAGPPAGAVSAPALGPGVSAGTGAAAASVAAGAGLRIVGGAGLGLSAAHSLSLGPSFRPPASAGPAGTPGGVQ